MSELECGIDWVVFTENSCPLLLSLYAVMFGAAIGEAGGPKATATQRVIQNNYSCLAITT